MYVPHCCGTCRIEVVPRDTGWIDWVDPAGAVRDLVQPVGPACPCRTRLDHG